MRYLHTFMVLSDDMDISAKYDVQGKLYVIVWRDICSSLRETINPEPVAWWIICLPGVLCRWKLSVDFRSLHTEDLAVIVDILTYVYKTIHKLHSWYNSLWQNKQAFGILTPSLLGIFCDRAFWYQFVWK